MYSPEEIEKAYRKDKKSIDMALLVLAINPFIILAGLSLALYIAGR